MAPPSWVASPPEQFHIQLPCGAASLPLPFGTGHETEHYNPIFSMSFLEHRDFYAGGSGTVEFLFFVLFNCFLPTTNSKTF
ncbi:hypothetical protein GLYMA_01G085302v4 [Glycine max]|nr:hypothetical protein GLYMA_01G085302v4 [Glycine max]KAH1162221.1 hypothetical protein GYH30_000917 [Glycine max]